MSRRATRDAPKPRNSQESVWSMFKSLFKNEKRSQRKPAMHSRSVAPAAISRYEAKAESVGLKPEEIIEDEEFFDIATSTSPKGYPAWNPPPAEGKREVPSVKYEVLKEKQYAQSSQPGLKEKPVKGAPRQNKTTGKRADAGFQLKRRVAPVNHRGVEEEEDDDDDIGDQIVGFFNNSNRKQSGLGIVARLLGTEGPVQGKNWKPRRPFFTIWVTLLQIAIYIIVSCTFGLAPISIDTVEVTGEVLMTSLVSEYQAYFTEGNMWIGPSKADLILVGAKYAPCMRYDLGIADLLIQDHARENETACCVRNDGAGCYQSLEEDCSVISTWLDWNIADGDARESGTVCGQDPDYCNDLTDVWADDLTEWPVCLDAPDFSDSGENHLTCDIIGRPCCIGIQGECEITTREYCDFVNGKYSDDATTCSQVSCLEDLCGLIPFVDPFTPDQVMRLVYSQFLHAGIFTMLITLLFQFIVMIGLENIIGWWKMAIVYLCSGIAGALASSIFLPYTVEAGPTGSQFGVLACLFIEVIRWNQYGSPTKTIIKLGLVLLVLFILGLLPSIDNWAHLFGLLFGIPFALAIRPFKTFKKKELTKCQRGLCSAGFALLALVLFIILCIIFFLFPRFECSPCSYFNCISITDTFCDSQSQDLTRSYS